MFGDLTRRKLGMICERLRCGLRIRAAAPNSRDASIGLDHVTLAA